LPVQQYFLDLEVALYKYKNYIIEGMNKKIEQLENNQKPKINANKKIIYVFRALNTDLTLYKIGKTINSKTRFSKHISPMANDLVKTRSVLTFKYICILHIYF